MGGVLGGGSKVFAEKATNSGDAQCWGHGQRSNGNAVGFRFVGTDSNPALQNFSAAAGGGAKVAGPGFEPLPTRVPVGCITTRPLLGLQQWASLLLGPASATDKKPKLCVSV